MKRHLGLLAAIVLAGAAAAHAESWVFRPSYFSHDPVSGQRVAQFAQPAPSYIRTGENYLQSGYSHNTITIGSGNNAQHLHVVETWGQGDKIRPYGEWLYPYRPGATPYGPSPYGAGYGPGQFGPSPYGPSPYGFGGNPYGPAMPPYGYGGNPSGLMRAYPPNLSGNPYSAAPYVGAAGGAGGASPQVVGPETGTNPGAYPARVGPPLIYAPQYTPPAAGQN
jgi:hypothetical protein